MAKFFKTRIMLIITIILSLNLVGCVEKSINPAEILPKSIDVMKNLDSYSSSVTVNFVSESKEDSQVNINALVTYHKEPFAYSNIQEITTTTESSDNPFDKFMLSLISKDGVVYTSNSITGLWLDETNPSIVKEVELNGEIFQNFNANQFTDLELISINKNKATIKGRSNKSDFIKSLLSDFSLDIVGDVEMIINTKTNHLESFVYYPEINGKLDKNNKITIITKDFNNASEIIVPEEAL